MACFIAPLTQAAMTTVLRRRTASGSNVWLQSLPQLEYILWGGSAMLVVDHIINGEVTWVYPFFTALNEANGVSVMLHEILTVGLPMCAVATALWAAGVALRLRAARAKA